MSIDTLDYVRTRESSGIKRKGAGGFLIRFLP
jgi:hypothetical protein